MNQELIITAVHDDMECLRAHREHPDAPTHAYGLDDPIVKVLPRTQLLRRFDLWRYVAFIDPEAHRRLDEDCAANYEAGLLKLNAGEFMGLQASAWRNRHQIPHRDIPPMFYWDTLHFFALYKRARAKQSKRADEAAQIEAARLTIKAQYERQGRLHSELRFRRAMGLTVH